MSDEEHRMGGIPNMPAHVLRTDGPQAGHGRTGAAFGRPGNPTKASVRILLEAYDPNRFDLDQLSVRAGETLEIVVRNAGHSRHEFVIGERQHQAEYARIVAAMPDTRHEHDNVLTVDPGQTRSIVWEFGDTAEVELACHMHGHYEQGMLVRVTVHR